MRDDEDEHITSKSLPFSIPCGTLFACILSTTILLLAVLNTIAPISPVEQLVEECDVPVMLSELHVTGS